MSLDVAMWLPRLFVMCDVVGGLFLDVRCVVMCCVLPQGFALMSQSPEVAFAPLGSVTVLISCIGGVGSEV